MMHIAKQIITAMMPDVGASLPHLLAAMAHTFTLAFFLQEQWDNNLQFRLQMQCKITGRCTCLPAHLPEPKSQFMGSCFRMPTSRYMWPSAIYSGALPFQSKILGRCLCLPSLFPNLNRLLIQRCNGAQPFSPGAWKVQVL